MKPSARKNKNGEIIGYRLYCYLGRDEFGKTKFKTKLWKPDKKYTPKQLEKELLKQQLLFEEKVKTETESISVSGSINMYSTFKELADYWIENYSKVENKASTTESYKIIINKCCKYIGRMKIKDITPIIINSMIQKIGNEKNQTRNTDNISAKTLKNHHTVLSSLFGTAVKWKIIDDKDNPMNGVSIPRTVKKKPKSLSSEQAKEILNALNLYAPIKYKLFFSTALYTGMRRGEICGLKWTSIDFDKKKINIENTVLYDKDNGVYQSSTKNESSTRIIAVSDRLIELFEEYKQEQDVLKEKLKWEDDLIFRQDNGKPMHPNTPYTWFKRFQQKYNLPDCNIHMLRHTAATLLILNGVDIKSVSGRLGHSSTSTTTDIYTAYLQERDEQIKDQLEDLLSDNKS